LRGGLNEASKGETLSGPTNLLVAVAVATRTMKVVRPVIKSLARAALAISLSSSSFSQTASSECKEIFVDSAGVVGFERSKIEAIAPYEVGGVALFVLIQPPARQLRGSDDILRITVSADVIPRPYPLCKKISDVIDMTDSITCFLSLNRKLLPVQGANH
jgi:hypothetical protein